jgi:hypothetical protein
MNELPLNERAQVPALRPESALAEKDPSTAFIIEFLGGFLGFMGLGYLYAGRVEDGVVRLVAWWVAGDWLVHHRHADGGRDRLRADPGDAGPQVAVPYWSADQLKSGCWASLHLPRPRPRWGKGPT